MCQCLKSQKNKHYKENKCWLGNVCQLLLIGRTVQLPLLINIREYCWSEFVKIFLTKQIFSLYLYWWLIYLVCCRKCHAQVQGGGSSTSAQLQYEQQVELGPSRVETRPPTLLHQNGRRPIVETACRPNVECETKGGELLSIWSIIYSIQTIKYTCFIYHIYFSINV